MSLVTASFCSYIKACGSPNDAARREKTVAKRGIDYSDAALVFAGECITVPDNRGGYGEPRFISVGELHGRFVVVACTTRGNTRRIISLRHCREGEAREWREAPPNCNLDNDPDEVPELTKEFFERGAIYDGEKLIRRGRPRLAAPKRLTSLRIDAAVLAGFRATGPGWQTRINDVLKDYLARHGRRRAVAKHAPAPKRAARRGAR
jgi:uncharacterized protein (DUF4415 family)/uncharacterized DUF497 family protein